MSLQDNLEAALNQEEEMFEYSGSLYTVKTFAENFNVPLDAAAATVAVLKKQGLIREEDPNAIADRRVKKALEEAMALSQAQTIEQDLLDEEINHRDAKRGYYHVHQKVTFDFNSQSAMFNFAKSVKALYLNFDTNRATDGKTYSLTVYDLSSKELDNLTRIYKLNNGVKTVVKGTEKAFNGAVKATNYTATNIAVPVAKIGFSGLLGIGKSLISTAAKLGGVAVTETVRTTRETAENIKTDESIAVAKAELFRTKNDLKQKINNKARGGNGIHVD